MRRVLDLSERNVVETAIHKWLFQLYKIEARNYPVIITGALATALGAIAGTANYVYGQNGAIALHMGDSKAILAVAGVSATLGFAALCAKLSKDSWEDGVRIIQRQLSRDLTILNGGVASIDLLKNFIKVLSLATGAIAAAPTVYLTEIAFAPYMSYGSIFFDFATAVSLSTARAWAFNNLVSMAVNWAISKTTPKPAVDSILWKKNQLLARLNKVISLIPRIDSIARKQIIERLHTAASGPANERLSALRYLTRLDERHPDLIVIPKPPTSNQIIAQRLGIGFGAIIGAFGSWVIRYVGQDGGYLLYDVVASRTSGAHSTIAREDFSIMVSAASVACLSSLLMWKMAGTFSDIFSQGYMHAENGYRHFVQSTSLVRRRALLDEENPSAVVGERTLSLSTYIENNLTTATAIYSLKMMFVLFITFFGALGRAEIANENIPHNNRALFLFIYGCTFLANFVTDFYFLQQLIVIFSKLYQSMYQRDETYLIQNFYNEFSQGIRFMSEESFDHFDRMLEGTTGALVGPAAIPTLETDVPAVLIPHAGAVAVEAGPVTIDVISGGTNNLSALPPRSNPAPGMITIVGLFGQARRNASSDPAGLSVPLMLANHDTNPALN